MPLPGRPALAPHGPRGLLPEFDLWDGEFIQLSQPSLRAGSGFLFAPDSGYV